MEKRIEIKDENNRSGYSVTCTVKTETISLTQGCSGNYATVEMDNEQARQLYAALHEMFGGEEIKKQKRDRLAHHTIADIHDIADGEVADILRDYFKKLDKIK